MQAKENILFKDLLGQSLATAFLSAALEKNKIAPAYIFSGPEGVGRKRAAMRFLEGILNDGQVDLIQRRRLENANHPDLLYVEPTYQYQGKLIPKSLALTEEINKRSTPQIRLEQIRDVSEFLGRIPLESSVGMVILESIETISETASNALLKTLEEPSNGILILLSSRPDCLLSTIRSRCQNIPFLPLSQSNSKTALITTLSSNGEEISQAINQPELLNLANGSPGALYKHIKIWETIPEELWTNLHKLPNNPLDGLHLAKEITESLDVEQQLWLIDWLEENIWIKQKNPIRLKRLEKLRSHLVGYVQPRIAWEVAILELIKC